ncbi:unnamed protein product [Symbiodinium natans]|uniref:Uncharacterized protein n=1 Tax=Symbiodinium natans TaxID=878477 RepID=A0A812J5R1_9DINO|nr:unnamed protein product [Symbiodinium natans]
MGTPCRSVKLRPRVLKFGWIPVNFVVLGHGPKDGSLHCSDSAILSGATVTYFACNAHATPQDATLDKPRGRTGGGLVEYCPATACGHLCPDFDDDVVPFRVWPDEVAAADGSLEEESFGGLLCLSSP